MLKLRTCRLLSNIYETKRNRKCVFRRFDHYAIGLAAHKTRKTMHNCTPLPTVFDHTMVKLDCDICRQLSLLTRDTSDCNALVPMHGRFEITNARHTKENCAFSKRLQRRQMRQKQDHQSMIRATSMFILGEMFLSSSNELAEKKSCARNTSLKKKPRNPVLTAPLTLQQVQLRKNNTKSSTRQVGSL